MLLGTVEWAGLLKSDLFWIVAVIAVLAVLCALCSRAGLCPFHAKSGSCCGSGADQDAPAGDEDA